MKKVVALFMAVMTFLSVFAAGIINVSAVNSTSKFSTPYKTSVYYTNLLTEKNKTGISQVDKFVNIAKSQLGYNEGIYYEDLNGAGKNKKWLSAVGCNDYKGALDVCEYNFWLYNCSDNSSISNYRSSTKKVNGKKYPVSKYDRAWCAAFVSWCIAQSGIPKAKINQYTAGCGDLYRGILGKEKYTGKIIKNSEHIGYVVNESAVKPGDIVFYVCPKNKDHSTKKYCHTGIVIEVTTDKNGKRVIYSAEGNSNDRVNKVKTSSTSTTCMECSGKTKREYLRLNLCSHSKTYSKVTKQATCTSTGSRTYYCSNCNVVTKTETIPVLKHSYDKYNHCSRCGKAYPCVSVSVNQGVYKTTKKTAVHSTPYEKKNGGASNTIANLSEGAVVTVEAKYKNKPGNLWYKVHYINSNGTKSEGYIYSKNISLYQNRFIFTESGKKVKTIEFGNTINVPTVSKVKKNGYVLAGFRLKKSNFKNITEYYVSNTKTWMTEKQIKANGYSYMQYKPGDCIRLDYQLVSNNNKYDTSYAFVPVWIKEQTYTVSYDANGGKGAPGPQTKKTNQTLVLSSVIPTNGSRKFLGWSTTRNGTVVNQPGGKYSANANVTYFAVWEADIIKWKSLYVQNITTTSAKIGCTVTATASKIKTIGLQLKASGGSWKSVASWSVGNKLEYCTVQCGGSKAEAPALKSNTYYEYRFYIKANDGRTLYSGTKSFTTAKPAATTPSNPSVTTPSNPSTTTPSTPAATNPVKWNSVYVQNITTTSAKIGCTVTADCSKLKTIGLQLKASGESWKSVASWSVGNKLEYCTVQCGGSNAEAPALKSNTYYEYRFYVLTNDGRTLYSDTKSFTTAKPVAASPIKWNTVYVKNITTTSALVGCTVTAECSKLKRIGLQLKAGNGSWQTVASWKVGSKLDYCTVQCGGSKAEAPSLKRNTFYSYRFFVEATSGQYYYSATNSFNTKA